MNQEVGGEGRSNESKEEPQYQKIRSTRKRYGLHRNTSKERNSFQNPNEPYSSEILTTIKGSDFAERAGSLVRDCTVA
jgi:hypothetical protein